MPEETRRPRTRRTPPRHTQRNAEINLYRIVDATYVIDGGRLNALLEKLEITQSELAEACGYRGMSRISHIVRGDDGSGVSKIKHGPLMKIIDYLNQHGADIEVYDFDVTG